MSGAGEKGKGVRGCKISLLWVVLHTARIRVIVHCEWIREFSIICVHFYLI